MWKPEATVCLLFRRSCLLEHINTFWMSISRISYYISSLGSFNALSFNIDLHNRACMSLFLHNLIMRSVYICLCVSDKSINHPILNHYWKILIIFFWNLFKFTKLKSGKEGLKESRIYYRLPTSEIVKLLACPHPMVRYQGKSHYFFSIFF